ncbi:MAG: hypothetical protein M3M99_05795, partial [Actinomycetota bacterium]|nr:hypothetical protein [Actinomycetota bacterium]
HASEVEKEKFEALEEVLAGARRRAEEIAREGGLGPINALRDFTPDQRVHARIEISPGPLRAPRGGLDVMGDGRVVPWRGALNKEPIPVQDLDEAIERLRELLTP